MISFFISQPFEDASLVNDTTERIFKEKRLESQKILLFKQFT